MRRGGAILDMAVGPEEEGASRQASAKGTEDHREALESGCAVREGRRAARSAGAAGSSRSRERACRRGVLGKVGGGVSEGAGQEEGQGVGVFMCHARDRVAQEIRGVGRRMSGGGDVLREGAHREGEGLCMALKMPCFWPREGEGGKWSGRRESNPSSLAWKARALPLDHGRPERKEIRSKGYDRKTANVGAGDGDRPHDNSTWKANALPLKCAGPGLGLGGAVWERDAEGGILCCRRPSRAGHRTAGGGTMRISREGRPSRTTCLTSQRQPSALS